MLPSDRNVNFPKPATFGIVGSGYLLVLNLNLPKIWAVGRETQAYFAGRGKEKGREQSNLHTK